MNLKKWQKNLSPSRKFKKELWRELDNRCQIQNPPIFAWLKPGRLKFAMVAVVVVLLVASGGAGAYAYTSPQVYEGTTLYKIKEKLEKLEEKTKRTAEAKTEFYVKQVQKREAEIRVMVDKNKDTSQTQERLQNVVNNLKKAHQLFVQSQKQNTGLQESVKEQLDKQDQIDELQKNILEDNEYNLNNLSNIVKDPVKREIVKFRVLEELRKRNQENQINKLNPLFKPTNTSTRPVIDQAKPAINLPNQNRPLSAVQSLKAKIEKLNSILNATNTSTKSRQPVDNLNNQTEVKLQEENQPCNFCDDQVYKDTREKTIGTNTSSLTTEQEYPSKTLLTPTNTSSKEFFNKEPGESGSATTIQGASSGASAPNSAGASTGVNSGSNNTSGGSSASIGAVDGK
ncbi:MAG: hypothetical protein ABIH87_04845 [bacterium]